MTITTAYTFVIPDYDINIPNITFSANAGEQTLVFTFNWFNDQWNANFVVNNELRLLNVIPYVPNGLYNYDYMVIFDNPQDKILQADLKNTIVWIYTW